MGLRGAGSCVAGSTQPRVATALELTRVLMRCEGWATIIPLAGCWARQGFHSSAGLRGAHPLDALWAALASPLPQHICQQQRASVQHDKPAAPTQKRAALSVDSLLARALKDQHSYSFVCSESIEINDNSDGFLQRRMFYNGTNSFKGITKTQQNVKKIKNLTGSSALWNSSIFQMQIRTSHHVL